MRIIIRDGIILTMDAQNRILKEGTLVIDGNQITQVAKVFDFSQHRADKVINAKNKLVMPGLINTHTHVCEHLSRGLYPDDIATLPWLLKYSMPFTAALTKEDLYLSSLVACIDMIRTGTTTFADSGVPTSMEYVDNIAQGIIDSGMRGIIGRFVCDRKPPLPDFWDKHWKDRLFFSSAEEASREVEEVVKRWNGRHPRIKAWAAIQGLRLNSDEMFLRVKEIARKYKVGAEYHIASSLEEVQTTQEETGSYSITHLEKIGALSHRVLLAHAIAVKEAELELLEKNNVKIAFCPGTALKLAKGVTVLGKFPEMISMGVTVSLGSDSICACGSSDMFRQIYLAAGLFKDARMDPQLIPAGQALYLATRGGAKALLLENEIGTIEEGKKADIILIDLNRVEWCPLNNISRNLVYSASGDSVDTVIIDGAVVMENRKILTLDEAELLEQSRKISQDIRKRAKLVVEGID